MCTHSRLLLTLADAEAPLPWLRSRSPAGSRVDTEAIGV